MTYLKQQLERLTPATAVSLLTAIVTLVAAFGVPVTKAQQASILVFGGSASLILFAHGLSKALSYLTPQTITGLVAAAIGVAISFGAPITTAQSDSVLQLTALIAGLLLVHGVVHTVARDRRAPERSTALPFEPKVAGRSLFSLAPRFMTGRRAPKNAPALLLRDILTGVVPVHPATADHFGKLAFGLYGNDKYGVCGPTSVANLVRLVTGGLLGAEITPSQEDVFDLYRRSGNPAFNPATGEGDNGVDMQTMLEALLAGGIGDGKGGTVKPVAFAKVNVTSDAELEAAVSIFGGVLWGVNLEAAQHAQTNAIPPEWDYRKSGEWGGHAVLNGAYESGQLEDVISWALRVETTGAFRAHQLEEAWVVIWPWNLEHPAFQAGVDTAALAAAYRALTGKELAIPTPTPTSTASEADCALWAAVKAWAHGRHSGTTKPIAARLLAWAKEVGLA